MEDGSGSCTLWEYMGLIHCVRPKHILFILFVKLQELVVFDVSESFMLLCLCVM